MPYHIGAKHAGEKAGVRIFGLIGGTQHNSKFSPATSITEFSRVTSLLFFFFWIFVVIFQNRTRSSPGKHIYLWLWHQKSPNIARVMKIVPVPFSKQPTFQARHGLPRKTSTIITHPGPETWTIADKTSDWNVPSIQIISTENTELEHHTSTSSIDFLFILHYMPKEKTPGQSFLLVQCVIDFLQEFLRTVCVSRYVFEVFVSSRKKKKVIWGKRKTRKNAAGDFTANLSCLPAVNFYSILLH